MVNVFKFSLQECNPVTMFPRELHKVYNNFMEFKSYLNHTNDGRAFIQEGVDIESLGKQFWPMRDLLVGTAKTCIY